MDPLFTPLDTFIFFGSLVLVMAIGLMAGRRENTSQDYFLAGRSARWWGVAGSIFGSNISANHIVGMMGIGFTVGFAQSHFEITAIAGLLLMCFGFLPVYRKLNVYTLSEYMSRRFNEASRTAYSVIMLTVIVVIQMSPAFYIGSRTLNVLLQEGETAAAVAEVGPGGTLTYIRMERPGMGYDSAPWVTFSPPPNDGGQMPTANALIANGQVSEIRIVTPGAGYEPELPPMVTLSGGAPFENERLRSLPIEQASKRLNPGDVNPTWYIAGILLMVVVTGVYTIIGGLKAVIVTDVIQSVMMLIAAIVVAVLTFGAAEIGG